MLTDKQELAIQKKILDTMPDQLKLPYALWTRKAVKELIKREFDIDLAITTTGSYLRSWGYSPQKPKKKALNKIQIRSKMVRPRISCYKRKSQTENAVIHWGDETGVRE